VDVTAGNGETIEYGVAQPVWKQLAAILRARIRSGRYQPRRAVPSEKQLEQEFGVARGTARKAIAALRSEGLVVTVAGRGTYVADPLPDED
jgi:DNA-binding GntR family transcriptional regulator